MSVRRLQRICRPDKRRQTVEESKGNLKSYCTLIGSMLIFGTIGIFRRYIPLSSGMLAFSRGLLGALALLLICCLRGRRTWLKMLLVGAFIGINWILLFESYNYTTVATATVCYYMQPIIVILLSPVFFRERLGAGRLICAAAAVAGMFLVSGAADGGGAGFGDLRGVLCGLGAAVFYAAVIILNKKTHVEDASEKTMIELFAASVVLLPYLLLTEDFSGIELSGGAVVMTLVVGIFHTGIAYAMYFGSLNRLRAQSVAVLSYIDPVFALLLSTLVLHEKMTVFGAVGSVMIIGSALVSELLPAGKSPSRGA